MPRLRLAPFLLLALAALLFGLWAGLYRLGWPIPALVAQAPAYHGALMVSGFLGAVIALERVAALRRRWMFAAPLLSGLGWIAGLLFPAQPAGPALLALASLVNLFVLLAIYRRDPAAHTLAMAAGALSWLVGNLLWLSGAPISTAVLWWAAFLILTISGERLELSRVLRPTRAQRLLFAAAAAVYLSGVILALFLPGAGWRLAGLGMLLLALWLLAFDLARRNLRHPIPLTRYIALCLFLGYFWLAAGGLLAMIYGAQQAGFFYDAQLHAVFLGFVISMIFGHAPIILPALLGVLLPFQPAALFNLALLHFSLLLRVAGDLALSPALRKWGGLFNEVAVLLFLALTIYSIRRANRPARKG